MVTADRVLRVSAGPKQLPPQMIALYKGTNEAVIQRSKNEENWQDSVVLSDKSGMNLLHHRRRSTSISTEEGSSSNSNRSLGNERHSNESDSDQRSLNEESNAFTAFSGGEVCPKPRSMMDMMEENGDEVRKRRVCFVFQKRHARSLK